ncbi:MAG: tetratricopeptide repeat protein [Nitrospirae bacterium]|nr:tetratricopeptide repeat protein [Nitrospirota bacterium]
MVKSGVPFVLGWDIGSLQTALKDKSEEYRQTYIAELIAGTHGKDFFDFMKSASVYRRPVDETAFKKLGGPELLEKGVSLTLFEKEHITGHEPVYWVNPIIRDSEFATLSIDEQRYMHRIAYEWYDKKLSDILDYNYMAEAVYHAMSYDENIRGAAKHAIPLGNYYGDILLYLDKMRVLQDIADSITDEVKEDAIKEKDENIPILLNNLGRAWKDLGDAKKAIEYYTKSLEIFIKFYGPEHPSTKRVQKNLDILKKQ